MTAVSRTLVCFTLMSAAISGAWAQQPAQKQINVFGQRISYLEAGAWPPVILLHGLGGSSANWALTVPALASSFHVYAPDQIGFGQSESSYPVPRPRVRRRNDKLVSDQPKPKNLARDYTNSTEINPWNL